MTYRLVALDLDGTLMASDLIIAPAVRAAIAAARARGVYVTVATGRMFGATLPFARQLDLRDPVICYQGALIRHPVTGAIGAHTPMDGEVAAEAVELLLAAGIFVIAYVDERLCFTAHRAEFDYYLRHHPEGAETVIRPDLPDLLRATPPTKLLFIAEPEIVTRELARLAPHFGPRAVTTRSHTHYGELTAPGVSKGRALATLAAQLGVPRDAVIAIGDQENDRAMIAWAGLGLAMGNATPAIKAAADAVIPAVTEEGVAWALRRYVLDGDSAGVPR